MADIAKAIRARLVAASVDSTATGGIYPDVLPQGCSYPAIRYALIGDESVGHLSGKSSLAIAEIQIDCYAATRIAANSLGDLVKIALDRYAGTVSSVQIVRIYVGSGSHSFREPADGSDIGVYRHLREYTVWYIENIS